MSNVVVVAAGLAAARRLVASCRASPGRWTATWGYLPCLMRCHTPGTRRTRSPRS